MISVYALVKQLGIGVVMAKESWSCREGAVSGGVRSRVGCGIEQGVDLGWLRSCRG